MPKTPTLLLREQTTPNDPSNVALRERQKGHKPMTTFAIRNLSVLAYANGFTLWHYKGGNATLTTMAKPDYFRDASDMLVAGDIVVITTSKAAKLFVVTDATEALTLAKLS